jgi:ABC-type branched-subunit amino acid transport system substrate-binding protein
MKASTNAPRPFARRSAGSATARLFLGLLAAALPGLASGQERELRIGIIGPFSGPAAGAAQQVLDGLMLGIDTAGGKLAGLKQP